MTDANQPGTGAVDPQHIPWRWDDRASSGSQSAPGTAAFELRITHDDVAIIRVDPSSGQVTWAQPVPAGVADTSAIATRGSVVYVALYRARVTGAQVWALDAATGRRIWEVPLQGVGLLHHSKYSNRVQIDVVGDWVVAFGDESAGRYVEVRDPVDGHLISNRVEKP